MPEQPAPIYVVSGGTGASGEQVVYTVLAQFPESQVPVITIAHVHHRAQVADAVAQAASSGGTIVHTLVDTGLRRLLIRRAEEEGIVAIDLMGPLLQHLLATLVEQPLGQPGLYRRLNQAYFDRVSAIDYAMAHDDGKDPAGWSEAEIVRAGSRAWARRRSACTSRCWGGRRRTCRSFQRWIHRQRCSSSTRAA